MKFRCHSCLAKYSIPDEKVRNKILKVRCKKCGAMLEVSEKSSITDDVEHPAPTAAAAAVRDPATLPPAAADGAPPRPAAAAGSSPSRGLPRREDGRPAVGRAPQQTPTTGRPALPPLPAIPDVPWFLGVRGQQEGPFSAPQLAARLRRGDYDPGKLLAWREGMERWIKVEQIPELAPYLERRAPTPAEPQRPPTLPPAPHPSTPSSAVMRALGAPPATASPTDRHAAAAGRAAPAAVSGGSGPHVMRPAPPAPATAGRTAPHAASGSSGPHIVRPPGPSSAAPPPPPPPPPPS
ncbi:MAG: DUF4339 domain-containing protein, partial [Deltaproteobacteria bacterium]|nr:DUF4339 domain-containing protein [Deltaproteobacteria bacterium]